MAAYETRSKVRDNDSVTLCRTKNGKGLKLVHNGIWYYVAAKHFNAMLRGERVGCVFNKYVPRVEEGARAPSPAPAPAARDLAEDALCEVEVV